MKELIGDYGHIPTIIIVSTFAIFWISIPHYLYLCRNLAFLIDQFRKHGFIVKKELGQLSTKYSLRWEYVFGLPEERVFPEYYKIRVIRKQIDDIKVFRTLYKWVFIIYGFILFPIIITARIYYVQGE